MLFFLSLCARNFRKYTSNATTVTWAVKGGEDHDYEPLFKQLSLLLAHTLCTTNRT